MKVYVYTCMRQEQGDYDLEVYATPEAAWDALNAGLVAFGLEWRPDNVVGSLSAKGRIWAVHEEEVKGQMPAAKGKVTA